MSITRKAILVGLHTSIWPNRKADKARSAAVERDAGAERQTVKVAKTLIAGAHFDALNAVVSNARVGIYYPNTLPWDDSSNRILPVALVDAVKRQFVQARDDFDQEVDHFITNEWPAALAAAPARLGDLYEAGDYPSEDKLRAAFKFSWDFSPIPEAGDFRVALEEDSLRELSLSYETQLAQRAKAASKEVWTRAYDALTHLAERVRAVNLSEYSKLHGSTDRAPAFHKSALENVREIADLMGALNVSDDLQLSEMAVKLGALVGGMDADTLKTQANARDSLLSGADWLIAEMEKRP